MPARADSVRYFTLTWALRDEHGGMTAALLRRSRMFAAGLGLPVTVLTFDPGRDYGPVRAALGARGLLDGVEVLNLWEWLASRPDVAAVTDDRVGASRRIRLLDGDGRVLREWRTIWAVYTSWLTALRAGHPAVLIADSKPISRFLATYRRRDVLTAHVMHGSHLDGAGAGWSAARRPVLDRIDDFDLVALLTHQQRRDLERRMGRRPNVRVLPNVADSAAVDPTGERRGGVVLASLEPRKRVDHALRAIARARELGATVQLDVFGAGPERAALEDGPGGATFHGFVPGASGVLPEFSFLLLTSRSEGSPLCVLEALAAGCLPIAYDIPFGPAEVIRTGVNGFLVPDGDIEALAAAIVELERLPAAAVEAMRRRAIATVAGYGEDAVLALWKRELRRAWRRKTWLVPRAGRSLRRRLAA